MSFCTVPGLEGKLFTPSPVPAAGRKHACPDCFACQACSQDRCRLCRSEGTAPGDRFAVPPEENNC